MGEGLSGATRIGVYPMPGDPFEAAERGPGIGSKFVKALFAYNDRVQTESHLYNLLRFAQAEPDRAKRAEMYMQATIDMAQFYLRGLNRGAIEPLRPELFETQAPAASGTGKGG
jgi:hypothetical protein